MRTWPVRRPRPRPTPEGEPRGVPPVIGLTGGIGAGKSAALAAFARRGAATLSADEAVHGLYDDPEVLVAVRARFGGGVLGAGGGVDRPALGRAAFVEVGGMAFLEQLLHPRVQERRERWVAGQRALVPQPPLLVCEVPLLFEVGAEGAFDAVLVVTAPEPLRRARVAARGQAAAFAALSARQLAEADKASRVDPEATYVNDGSLEELDAWVGARFAACVGG